MDAFNRNKTVPADSDTERSQWDLELMGSHYPPHQPLIPYTSKVKGYEKSMLHVIKLRETIAEIASDFEESKVIHEKMTLDKLLVAVRVCRKMTLFDLRHALTTVNLQSRNKKQLSER
jgi:hypothetical protein